MKNQDSKIVKTPRQIKKIIKESYSKGYNWNQQMQFKYSLKNDLNLENYVDRNFNWVQMAEVNLGLKHKIDVTIYADSKIPAEKMKEIRLLEMRRKIFNKKNPNNKSIRK